MSLEVESPFEYKDINDLTLGIDVSLRPELLQPGQLVTADNVYFKERRVLSDTGYDTFLETVRGTPRACFQFFKKNGSSELVLITNATFYTRTSDEWQYVSDGVNTTLTANASATDTSITVDDITGFSDGYFIGIELNDGTQHKTSINGAPVGSTINLDDAMPSAADSGNVVVKAVDLTGSDNYQISLVVLAAFDYLVFTNNTDNVKYYDGSTCEDIPNMPSAGNCKARAVALFQNHLLLLGTTEGGTAFPQRVRNSDTADITEWVTGNAGFTDLYDSEDFLSIGVPLGPYMVLYRERSIVRMEYIGTTDKLFNFDPVVTGEGASSPDSVVDIGTEHVFWGNSNVYRYQGGFDIEPIADPVYNLLFGKDKEVNPSYVSRVICLYVEELDEVWFIYPTSASEYPNKIARLKLENDAWYFRTLSIYITGYGFFQTNTTLKWSELTGSWLDQTWQWGGSTTQANSPTTILCSSDGSNQCYEYNYIAADDNGTAISWIIETGDLSNPLAELRTDWLDFKAKGETITIEYSTDNGGNYSIWATPTLDSVYQDYRKHKQIVGKRIRFKISGTGSGFGLEYLGLRYRLESIH